MYLETIINLFIFVITAVVVLSSFQTAHLLISYVLPQCPAALCGVLQRNWGSA